MVESRAQCCKGLPVLSYHVVRLTFQGTSHSPTFTHGSHQCPESDLCWWLCPGSTLLSSLTVTRCSHTRSPTCELAVHWNSKGNESYGQLSLRLLLYGARDSIKNTFLWVSLENIKVPTRNFPQELALLKHWHAGQSAVTRSTVTTAMPRRTSDTPDHTFDNRGPGTLSMLLGKYSINSNVVEKTSLGFKEMDASLYLTLALSSCKSWTCHLPELQLSFSSHVRWGSEAYASQCDFKWCRDQRVCWIWSSWHIKWELLQITALLFQWWHCHPRE